MEKQPNSRMCFVCGIENPIGLDGAPLAYTLPFTATTGGGASPASGRSRSTGLSRTALRGSYQQSTEGQYLANANCGQARPAPASGKFGLSTRVSIPDRFRMSYPKGQPGPNSGQVIRDLTT
jgi:hypothetical protein